MTQKSGWQLSGDAADIYESIIVPAFVEEWTKDLVKRAELKEGENVLDAACGTGIVARNAAAVVGSKAHVTGVDINKVMLDKAREISARCNDNIHWQQDDITALDLQDEAFDVVLCQQGLQYFSDRTLALEQIHRALVPGGRIVFSFWRGIQYFPFYTALHKALGRYVGNDAALTLASAFSITDTTQLKSDLKKMGFKNICSRLVIKQMHCTCFEDFFYGGMAASPFAKDLFALNKAVINEMFNDISESVLNYMDDDGLVAPMEAYVLTAGK